MSHEKLNNAFLLGLVPWGKYGTHLFCSGCVPTESRDVWVHVRVLHLEEILH